MKTILDKIYEYSTPDNVDDEIEFLNKEGKTISMYIDKSFRDDSARAFMLNIKTKKVAMGRDQNDYHYDIIENDIDDACNKMNIDSSDWTCRIEKGEDAEEFYEENPHMKNIRCGRLWDLRDAPKIKSSWDEMHNRSAASGIIVIGWWEELSTAKWYSYTMNVLRYVSKKLSAPIDFENDVIIGIDNNGELFVLEIKAKRAVKKKLDKRSEDSNKLYGIAKAIHLANQKDKDEFYAAFKKNRDEQNQKIYNHTKSKTEAEYRSLKYQENLKSINDIVNETSK